MVKKYTKEEKIMIREQYLKKYSNLPYVPRGCCCEITDLMEAAIKRGKPLKYNEYEERIKQHKERDGVIY